MQGCRAVIIIIIIIIIIIDHMHKVSVSKGFLQQIMPYLNVAYALTVIQSL
jgi:hypothetical protein